MIETPDGKLSAGMRQLTGVYTQRFNRRHGRVGHVFQVRRSPRPTGRCERLGQRLVRQTSDRLAPDPSYA